MALSPEISTDLVAGAIGDSREFGRELSEATTSYIGRVGVIHKKLAGCGFGDTTERCMEVGLGPEFDCSGLVIVGACDVLGISTDNWSADQRHVRQMASEDLLRSTGGITDRIVTAGWLHVFGAFVRVNGRNDLRPVHIGVALGDNRGYPNPMVHAVAGEYGVQEDSIHSYVTNWHNRETFYLGSLNPAHLANIALSGLNH